MRHHSALLFALLLAVSPAVAQPADTLSLLQRVQSAAESGNREAFKSALAAARNSGSDLIALYTAIERIWDYSVTSPTGSFIDESEVPPVGRTVTPIVDASGARFYPTREVRELLVREAARELSGAAAVPAAVVAPPPPPPPPPPALPPPPAPARDTRAAPQKPLTGARVVLPFRDAVARAIALTPGEQADLGRALLELQRTEASRLPLLRANADGRVARTTDVFADRPLDLQSVSATVSADYTLVSPRLLAARREEASSQAQYLRARIASNREIYERLINAYSDVYGFQKRQELLGTAYSMVQRNDTEASHLLESGHISLVTATSSHEALLSIRERMLDLELQRMMAERRLRELVVADGDSEIVVDLAAELDRSESASLDRDTAIANMVSSDPTVAALQREIGRARLAVQEADSRTRPRTDVSAYVGLGAAHSNFEGLSSASPGVGIYGLNVRFSYPLLDRMPQIDRAAAQLELQRNEAKLATAMEAARARAAQEWLQYVEAGKRVAILREWGSVQRDREASLQRLISAGVRRETELSQAISERTRQEEELMLARLQRWRSYELLSFPRSTP